MVITYVFVVFFYYVEVLKTEKEATFDDGERNLRDKTISYLIFCFIYTKKQ